MATKKAQGLSLNTIIIGAIVLIVLVVVISILTGYFGSFLPQFKSASQKECPLIKAECDPTTEKQIFGNFGESVPPGMVCCAAKVLAPCGDAEDGFCTSESGCELLDDFEVKSGETICTTEGKICCVQK